jgi:hypothetical protein
VPESGRADPVADAAGALAEYVGILEQLLAEPVAEGPAPGMTGRAPAAPEPWYTPAGHALMDAWEGVFRLEAALRYAKTGHPGPTRGRGADAWQSALAALPGLAAGLTAEGADQAVRALFKWIDPAKSVHGIGEPRRLRHLPRRAGDALPPRCPNCRCFALVADLDARVVYCTVTGCQDRNGSPPVATLTTTADGRPALAWADGLTEMAPDLDLPVPVREPVAACNVAGDLRCGRRGPGGYRDILVPGCRMRCGGDRDRVRRGGDHAAAPG